MSFKEIIDKCHENKELGCDTIDLVILRKDKAEAEYLAPGQHGPMGSSMVPYMVEGVQRGWVVNFNIAEVLAFIERI